MLTRKAGLKEATRRINEARKSNAASLDLARLDLTALPEALGQLANLQTLDLNDNQITALPEALGQLANLQELYLGNNQITALPEALGQLANLQTLFLGNNRITALPEALGQLANLQTLYLSGNQITALPEALGQLANLQTLALSGNQITALPEALGQLANLQTLFLSDNRITALPEALGQLANLQTLYLGDNRITVLPEALGQLPKLTKLFLHGNPNLGVPEEILGPTWQEVLANRKQSKPPREILDYFKSLADAQPLHEAKLIMVGQGEVGKTSLVKTILTGKFDSLEKTTEGIKIDDWRCPIAGGGKVTVHIWDFGGQEIMHATHQFFLTARSLYLLVLIWPRHSHDDSDREAHYWFRLIRAFGGKDAPVIVVLNKQRSKPFDVNRGGWLEKYAANIKGFVETDCADLDSIDRLKRTIQEQLQEMKSLKAGFPRRWFAIKDELSRMGSAYVTFEGYRALCRKHGEDDPGKQTSLAGFLHDLGIALNYKDDLRLRFAYVLKPEWVTAGIYALLHAFVRSKGLFSHAEAEQILAPKGYSPAALQFILALMERFELSFALGDSQKRVLIPQLLDDQQPPEAQSFKAAECLNFGYQYSIVPEGLLPRFIVRTHHLGESKTRWKSGVILQDGASGCRALVRADAVEGQVRIHVDGPEGSRREMLAIVRNNFEAIHADYEFQPEGLVYPPGFPEKSVSLDELNALAESGSATIPIVLPGRRVIKPSIDSLLDPVKVSPPLKLFLSYAHKDEKHVDELRKDLKLMERNGLIRTWYDRALSAGERWEESILQELNSADVIVCQLSRDFLASDFCVLTELDTAIRRKMAGEAELIAYVLKECGWKEAPKLKQFQLLPQDAKPLCDWKTKDKYWRAVAEGIQRALEKLREKSSRHSGLG